MQGWRKDDRLPADLRRVNPFKPVEEVDEEEEEEEMTAEEEAEQSRQNQAYLAGPVAEEV